MKKKAIITLIIISTLFVLAAILGTVYYFTHKITYEENLSATVNSNICITRDDNGIPEIKVKSIDDIYFSMGYLHAQDRLILMEYYRAIATGNISKLIGRKGKVLENIAKVIGFVSKSDEISKKLNEQHRNNIIAYTNGVNYIRDRGFYDNILERDWQVTDVISVLLLREWANAFINNKENIFQFYIDNKSNFIKEMFPPDLVYYYDKEQINSLVIIKQMKNILQKYVGSYNKGFAFHITGRSTKDGSPITGFSIDNNLNIYPCWYPVHIVYNEKKIKGITLAGLPFIFMGENDDISFYGFSLDTDTQDFHIEKVKKINDIQHFQSIAGWKEFIPVREPILEDNIVHRHEIIWNTDNGPVLNDIFEDKKYGESVVTMKSIFPKEDYIASLFDIPFCENIYEARNKVRYINSLPRVYLFSSGNLVIKTYSGKIPQRNMGNFIFNTNVYAAWNRVADLSVYEYNLFNNIIGSSMLSDSPYAIKNISISNNNKFLRLKKLLNQSMEITTKDVKNILEDNYSINAEKFTPIFLSILKTNPVTSARLTRIYFKTWKNYIDQDKIAPAIFYILLQNFISETCGDEFDTNINDIIANYDLLTDNFYNLIFLNSSYIFDDINTEKIENRDIIFDIAFIKSMRFLNRKLGPIMDKWQWEKIHRGHFHIPIQETTLINKLFYKIKDRGLDGGTATLLQSKVGKNLTALSSSSLYGFLKEGSSQIKMNFSYSINPMSKFYYGKKAKKRFIDFDRVKKINQTKISSSLQ